MKFFPYRGYAPGDYFCHCSKCGKEHYADKRATSCVECAFQGTPVFVFGSNLDGRHGKGAALHARIARGAIYGQGEGHQGNSYAIPTKGRGNPLSTLPLDRIEAHVLNFLAFVICHPELTFQVTPIGCGLAGYAPEQIAPLFAGAPDNCVLPSEFKHILNRSIAA